MSNMLLTVYMFTAQAAAARHRAAEATARQGVHCARDRQS